MVNDRVNGVANNMVIHKTQTTLLLGGNLTLRVSPWTDPNLWQNVLPKA